MDIKTGAFKVPKKENKILHYNKYTLQFDKKTHKV